MNVLDFAVDIAGFLALVLICDGEFQCWRLGFGGAHNHVGLVEMALQSLVGFGVVFLDVAFSEE